MQGMPRGFEHGGVTSWLMGLALTVHRSQDNRPSGGGQSCCSTNGSMLGSGPSALEDTALSHVRTAVGPEGTPGLVQERFHLSLFPFLLPVLLSAPHRDALSVPSSTTLTSVWNLVRIQCCSVNMTKTPDLISRGQQEGPLELSQSSTSNMFPGWAQSVPSSWQRLR